MSSKCPQCAIPEGETVCVTCGCGTYDYWGDVKMGRRSVCEFFGQVLRDDYVVELQERSMPNGEFQCSLDLSHKDADEGLFFVMGRSKSRYKARVLAERLYAEEIAKITSMLRLNPIEQSTFILDASPLDSDFETLSELTADLDKFKNTHPNHIVIRSDDPGRNNRVPRMGWTAYLEGQGDEQIREWTIPLHKIRKA